MSDDPLVRMRLNHADVVARKRRTQAMLYDALERIRELELELSEVRRAGARGAPRGPIDSRKAAVERLRELADDVENRKVGITCMVESGGEIPRYALLIVELVYPE